jgi:hypothetical protein
MSPPRERVVLPPASSPAGGTLPPIPLGLSGGILTTLMLAGDRMTSGGVTLALCFQVALSASSWNFFAVLLMRSGILHGVGIRAEGSAPGAQRRSGGSMRDNRMQHGFCGALLAGASGFVGALLPLTLASLLADHPWLVIGLSLLTSSAMGIPLARSMRDSVVRWVLWLALAGCAMTALGRWLRASERENEASGGIPWPTTDAREAARNELKAAIHVERRDDHG